MELAFSSDSHKHFDCSKCRQSVKKLRKCETNRWDYTFEKDGNPFPMEVFKGGNLYGFCPGKAQWYSYLTNIYEIMASCCEMGVLPYSGGLLDQPEWFIRNIGWFSQRYQDLASVTRSGLGGKLEKNPSPKGGSKDGGKQGSSLHNRGKRLRR